MKSVDEASKEQQQVLKPEEKQGLQEFAYMYRRSVYQHTVRAKTKEETIHLPYKLSFCVQAETMQGKEVATRVLATNGVDETDRTGTNSTQGYEIMFQKGEVLVIK